MNLLKWLQFITILLSPLYIIRGSIVYPTTILEILILTTFLVWIVVFFKDGLKWNLLKTKFNYLILFFLITALVAAFRNPELASGLGIFRAYFLEPILFFYTLTFTVKKTGGKFIIYALILSGIWLAVLSILQKVTGSFTLAPYEIALGRVSAVYNSANALALFLGPISILSLVLIFSKSQKVKILGGLLFIIFFLVIIWTKSRGGLTAEVLAIVTFFYILFSQKRNVFSKTWFLVPIAIVIASSIFFQQVFVYYNQTPLSYRTTLEDSDTLKIRYFLWQGSINLIKDHPIFGAGLEGFKPLYQNNYKLHPTFEAFQYPHNIFLTFWAEMGIFGLIAFILLLASIFNLLILKISKTKDPVILASLTAVFIYWLIHGLVDVPYFKNDLSLEFWVFVVLVKEYT